MYDGVLTSGSGDSLSTEFVCLDRSPVNEGSGSENPLVPDWTYVAGGGDEDQILLACVVCAK